MSRIVWNREVYERIEHLLAEGKTWSAIGDELGCNHTAVKTRYYEMKALFANDNPSSPSHPGRIFRENKAKNEASVEVVTANPVKTEQDALRVAEVDLSIWYVHSWECRQWTTPLNVKRGQKVVDVKKVRHTKDGPKDVTEQELKWRSSRPMQQQQYLVALKLRRKSPEVLSVEALLQEIKQQKITLPKFKPPKVNVRRKRIALELSIMDPHLGLRCFAPAADKGWSIDEAETMFMATVERLLAQVTMYGPFEEIVVPIGNDYFHADSIWHDTTGGTPQPEMDALHHTYIRGEKLILWFTERLRSLNARLKLYSIPGNHDRFTSFTMARLVQAFYEGAKLLNDTVFVDASPSPYKFWNYGVNLIGFEHGHSVKPIRLASLMANETRLTHWQTARYCEWHLGDQHRKGSSKPSTFEEQGVSVEYLPSLTPPNEWHRLKAFNWQKRGAMAFVYDYASGPVTRLQVNFDSYTGKHLGAAS